MKIEILIMFAMDFIYWVAIPNLVVKILAFKKKRCIWSRIILVSLLSATIFLLIQKSPEQLAMLRNIATAVLILYWCFEDDDNHRKRRRRRKQILDSIKRNLEIHGWQPGAMPQTN